jgi:hypothetical protein
MPNIDLGEAQASGVLSIRAVEHGSAATLRPVDGGPAVADALSALLAVGSPGPSGPARPVVALDITMASTADDAPAVLAALIEQPRPALRRLALREEGFDPEDCGELAKPAVTTARLGDLTAHLPALEELTLVLACLSDGLRHRTLRTLDMVAVAFTGSWAKLDLPGLHRLRYWLPGDVYGCAVEGDFLDSFWKKARLPALRELDLADLETDGTVWTRAMRDSALLPRLDVLRVMWLVEGDEKFLGRAPLSGLSRYDVRITDTPEVETTARQLVPALNVVGE